MSLPYFLVVPLTIKRLSHFTMQTGIAAAVTVISLVPIQPCLSFQIPGILLRILHSHTLAMQSCTFTPSIIEPTPQEPAS